MKLQSPKHPEIDDVPEAIEYYYTEKKYSLRKIAKFLGLSHQQVHRVLNRRNCTIRSRVGNITVTFSDGGQERTCRVCDEELPLNDKYFHRDRGSSGGFKYVCKKCRGSSGQ